ncbi:MAG: hypothetical protein V4468_03560 [Pseudomonadota bacterium]|nr:MAG TPA: hypothetical protein [Caudoviricetes sp.]
MKAAALSAEIAYAKAVEQVRLRAAGATSNWLGSRALFWSAVRFGFERLQACACPEARSHWEALWSMAVREHLPPIPGIPEAENMPSDATAAELEFARMRAIVGGKGKR